MSAARKHTYRRLPVLGFVKVRKTYNLFGFGQHMTAGQIIALFAAAALAVVMIWGGLWLFCAVMYAFGIDS